MKAGEAILDAFINANILILVCYAFWIGARALMQLAGFRQAYTTQLRLLNALFLAIVCAPMIAVGFHLLQGAGVARGVKVNLSDAIVAYYLNGGFQMDSSQFETLVLARDGFVLNVLTADGWLARIAISVFLAGFALGALRFAVSAVRLGRIISDSYAWHSIGRVRIRLSDRVIVPFSTRGLHYYYIVIPSDMLGRANEAKVAIAHELQHIRQGDLEWEVALEVLKPIFFLNPAYRAWKRQVDHLRELSCDQEVLMHGRVDVRSYCETLLSVCQKTLRSDRTLTAAVPKVTMVTAEPGTIFPVRRSFLETRIRSALDVRRQSHQRLLFAAIAAPLLAATTLATLAIQSPGDWSHDRLMLSTVVNLDRLDKINQLSTFGRLRN